MNSNLKRKKHFIIGGVLLLIIIVVATILIYLNTRKDSYSFLEKNWINSNINSVIDINIQTNLPVFSESGNGVFYDFVNDFETDTKLSLNVVDGNTAYNLVNKASLSNSDILIYKDHYVLVSISDNKVMSVGDLQSQSVGVLSEDLSRISDELSAYSNITYTSYASIAEINNNMNDSIAYAILPLYKYLSVIMTQNYHIVYHFNGLNSYYVLTRPEEDTRLNSIFEKFSVRWKEEKNKSLNSNLLDLYYNKYQITDVQKEEITNEDFVVGFINNLPVEGKINRNFNGITNEYLNKFYEFAGSTYKYVEFSNVESLIKALNDSKIDMAFNNYGINNQNYQNSVALGSTNYVVVAHEDNNAVIMSLKSLRDNTVNVLASSNLNTYVKSLNIKTNEVENIKKLLKSASEEDILVIEKEVYDYYKNDELEDYSIRYMGYAPISASFLFSNSNVVFNNLFNFYLSVISSESLKYEAVNHAIDEKSTNLVVNFLIKNITYILILVIAIVSFFYIFNKKIQVTKKIKKEDKLLYLDIMTNLKNRNYLNDNIEYWESNKVYPQAIVTVDLKRIKELNDAYGHAEGDIQIKAAANILIKTQRENSEIIRSDGNEFLIYLVGYEEKMIVTYMHKLTKEFNSLPHAYGVSMGYAMITDEIKSIDDAINEALIMMRKNKELQ